MEIIGQGLMAIGKAIGAWATAYGFIYVAAICAKTWLITNGDATPDELKNWFDFGFGRKKGGSL